MNTTEYLNRNALYRKLVYGPYRVFAGVYAAKMSNEGLGRQCTLRSLSLFRDLMDWHVGNGHAPQDLSGSTSTAFLSIVSNTGSPARALDLRSAACFRRYGRTA